VTGFGGSNGKADRLTKPLVFASFLFESATVNESDNSATNSNEITKSDRIDLKDIIFVGGRIEANGKKS